MSFNQKGGKDLKWKRGSFLQLQFQLLFHDGGPYHIETSPMICRGNQWTRFYMIGTSVMKELDFFVLFSRKQNNKYSFRWVAEVLLLTGRFH